MATEPTYRRTTPNTFEPVKAIEEEVDQLLNPEKPFPFDKIKRAAILLLIAHAAFLVFAFTTIVVIRYAFRA